MLCIDTEQANSSLTLNQQEVSPLIQCAVELNHGWLPLSREQLGACKNPRRNPSPQMESVLTAEVCLQTSSSMSLQFIDFVEHMQGCVTSQTAFQLQRGWHSFTAYAVDIGSPQTCPC